MTRTPQERRNLQRLSQSAFVIKVPLHEVSHWTAEVRLKTDRRKMEACCRQGSMVPQSNTYHPGRPAQPKPASPRGGVVRLIVASGTERATGSEWK